MTRLAASRATTGELFSLLLLLLLRGLRMDLSDRLGRRLVVPWDPVVIAQVHHVHQHESHARGKGWALEDIVDSLKVHVHAALVVA